ncbi:hypothetical protein GMST_10930 [Geomonas silvestris]|uniref:4Fe-4S ferredoxin-type domain-containing protein n=1 Tax=Geomonas silvestris TaxID=2740184 RepID=A0A6V8MFK1_9BACT|nr:4Fe-4S dicluster domain-containing protein [Geomonas silvestris]GFO58768.1 hypothetical protein GMST_10930 [Geomonas silvestris]
MHTCKVPPLPKLRLYRINTGSCNGCDVELAATEAITRFGLDRLGLSFTADPTQADLVLITGPLTVSSREKVLAEYAEVPDPKITVLIGVCPISGGAFRDSYAVVAPLDEFVPVDLNIPGCPPRPQAIVAGIAKAVQLWRGGEHPPVSPGPEEGSLTENLRGRMRYRAEACVGCRICQHVCAGGAIRFDEEEAGLGFTLWHNSCLFCGMCSHYCPTGALAPTREWDLAHRQAEKYRQVEKGVVPRIPCSACGVPMLPVVPELMKKGYRALSAETARLQTLCSECRQVRSLEGVKRCTT